MSAMTTKTIVEAIEIYLTQEGYHILKAYDGQEALDILTSGTSRSADHGYHDAPS